MNTQPAARRVVCGLDDSPHAPEVLNVASAMANRLDLELSVVHSANPDIYMVGAHRREVLRQAQERLGALIAGHRVDQLTVQLGDPAALLHNTISADTSVLVVGSRGHGPARAVLGSVSAELSRSAPCPVVVVPPRAPVYGPDTATAVLCGLDGSDHSVHALHSAATLAAVTDAWLHAVYVRTEPAAPDPEGEHAFRALVEREIAGLPFPVRVSMHVEGGDTVTVLDELALTRGAGMIVVGTRGASPLRSALHGSVSGRLAATARTPVMIVSEKARLRGLRVHPRAHVAA